jgi:hypothetical protein
MKRLILISVSLLIGASAFGQRRCVSTPANIQGRQVTVTTSGNKALAHKQVYIYYTRRHHHKADREYPVAGISDRYPSAPLLMATDEVVTTLPETYNVSLVPQQNTVSVCPDSVLNLDAEILLTRNSAYTGNYPGGAMENKVYKKVTKHQYKVAARKMRKAHRKEVKIARRSGLPVEVRTPATASI